MDFVVSTNEFINSQNQKNDSRISECDDLNVISFRFEIIIVFCAQLPFVLLEFRFWWFVGEEETKTSFNQTDLLSDAMEKKVPNNNKSKIKRHIETDTSLWIMHLFRLIFENNEITR